MNIRIPRPHPMRYYRKGGGWKKIKRQYRIVNKRLKLIWQCALENRCFMFLIIDAMLVLLLTELKNKSLTRLHLEIVNCTQCTWIVCWGSINFHTLVQKITGYVLDNKEGTMNLNKEHSHNFKAGYLAFLLLTYNNLMKMLLLMLTLPV